MEQVITLVGNLESKCGTDVQVDSKTVGSIEKIDESERIHIAKCMAEIAEEMKRVEQLYKEVNLDRLKRKVLRLCQY